MPIAQMCEEESSADPRTQSLNSYISLYNNMSQPIHYPQLDTVLMVEEFIKEHSGEYKKRKLWESLPKKMMYQTFCVIYDYLAASQKIAADKDGVIGWIWDPQGVEKYLSRKELHREDEIANRSKPSAERSSRNGPRRRQNQRRATP